MLSIFALIHMFMDIVWFGKLFPLRALKIENYFHWMPHKMLNVECHGQSEFAYIFIVDIKWIWNLLVEHGRHIRSCPQDRCKSSTNRCYSKTSQNNDKKNYSIFRKLSFILITVMVAELLHYIDAPQYFIVATNRNGIGNFWIL